MATYKEITETLIRRKFIIFKLDDTQIFFAQKRQKMLGFNVILNVGYFDSIMNMTLECSDCLESQILKINKQMSIFDILSIKVPFWYIYESSLNDIRNSFHELLIQNNLI